MKLTALRRVAQSALAIVLATTLAVPLYGVATGANPLPQAFAAAGFPDDDVVPGAWYEDSVAWAVENRVIMGYPDGTFKPGANITRADVAVILCRAAGADTTEGEGTYPENKTSWTDVLDCQYYTHAMNWAYETGVFRGSNAEPLVYPGRNITREEIAAVIVRFAAAQLGLNTNASNLNWPQGTLETELVSPYATDSLLWTCAAGVMGGSDNQNGTRSLKPQANATRAEFAAVCTSLIRDVEPTWPDHGLGRAEDIVLEPTDITPTTAAFAARNAYGEDITPYCEFSLGAGDIWTDEPTFSNLNPETYYTAYARLVGRTDVAPRWYSFLTDEPYGTFSAPANIDAKITDTTASVTATAINGYDITSSCEYALVEGFYGSGATSFPDDDDFKWQDESTFDSLKPDTAYTVFARMKASGGWLASSVNWVSFRTHEKVSGTATVTEYLPVEVKTLAAIGLDAENPETPVIVSYESTRALSDAEKEAVDAAAKELEAYYTSMLNESATEADTGWDRVTGYEERTYRVLVKVGSHTEQYDNETEYNALKAHGESALTQEMLAITGIDCTDAWTITTSDGVVFSSKMQAWNHCLEMNRNAPSEAANGDERTSSSDDATDGIVYPVTIKTVVRETLNADEPFVSAQTVEEMLAASGIAADEIWCLQGETILS